MDPKKYFWKGVLGSEPVENKKHQIRGAAYLTREWVLYVWLVVDFTMFWVSTEISIELGGASSRGWRIYSR